ncbi:hypothetical protein [Variovorax terrae]|uniref:Transmembrane protein n=1 Tax=Variovorax terrae TaxID=2923278 RepID=A0A9X1VY72_9BURK|nr:hypothetical protein [Variovorax terrae]MCJ0765463.1 hypothetical protein [Variovorax terrae]
MAGDHWDALRHVREKRRFIESRLRWRWVGVHAGLIFGVTWASGWLISALLVRWNVANMPLRYAISFALSYPVFFLCVRVWSDFMRQERGSGEAMTDLGANVDFPVGDGEGCLLALAAVALGMLLAAAFAWIGGPALLLEAAFEVVFAGVLVKRLGRVDVIGSWARVLLRGTLPFAAATLLALVMVAGLLQHHAPAARTFSEAVRHIWPATDTMDGAKTTTR